MICFISSWHSPIPDGNEEDVHFHRHTFTDMPAVIVELRSENLKDDGFVVILKGVTYRWQTERDCRPAGENW